VDGLNYQGDVAWDVPMYQARLVDTLKQFAAQGYDLRDFEQDAAREFTQDHPNEDEVNLRSYLMMCTNAPIPVLGYGNGARRPDGNLL
jgi:hypothetical protein